MGRQTTIDFNNSEMTSDERLVWHALSGCKGKALAVKQHELAYACKMNPKEVLEIITNLIFNYRRPIASSQNKVAYYLIQNEEEALEAADRYRKQAIKNIQREAILRNISEKELMKEIQMEFEE